MFQGLSKSILYVLSNSVESPHTPLCQFPSRLFGFSRILVDSLTNDDSFFQNEKEEFVVYLQYRLAKYYNCVLCKNCSVRFFVSST